MHMKNLSIVSLAVFLVSIAGLLFFMINNTPFGLSVYYSKVITYILLSTGFVSLILCGLTLGRTSDEELER